MNADSNKKNIRGGRWLVQTGLEPFEAFIPPPLPPNPPIKFDLKLYEMGERANRALGQLDGNSNLLPDPTLFLYTFARKEAVLSSQIEGTQSSLSDLLLFENEAAPGVPLADAQEVSNYVSAMQYGLDRLKGGFPLSLRLIKEIHGILLNKTRGSEKEPGEFRRSQNWIGGSRPGNAIYVPPPPDEVIPAMGALDNFLHDKPLRTPALIKAGLAHAQFETIHPFLDGNGRVGRLLITFILCVEGAISQPLLYLSLYFKQNRETYYDLLQKIRTEGRWEEWLIFYLTGIEDVSRQATATAKKLILMFEKHRQKIQPIGRSASSALRLHELLKKKVVLSIPHAQKELDLSFPAVNNAITNLLKLGFVQEVTGKQRNRLYFYKPYMDVLNEGLEKPR